MLIQPYIRFEEFEFVWCHRVYYSMRGAVPSRLDDWIRARLVRLVEPQAEDDSRE